MTNKSSYSDNIEIIEQELAKRRSSWQLSSINWVSYEDVAQQIRIHIFNKWDQWDQTRPLKRWLATVIKHQMINMSKSLYSNFTRPCLQCAYNIGGGGCSKTASNRQSSECHFYKKWESSAKKQALDLKVPVSMHDDGNQDDNSSGIKIQIESKPDQHLDYEKSVPRFHQQMKSILKPSEWKFYEMIYIKNMSDEEVAKEMNYKTSEENRTPGYKKIKKVKNLLYKKAQSIIKDVV